MSQYLLSDERDFSCFNDFFTRELAAQARPLHPDIRHMIAPADGTLSACGQVAQQQLIQCKHLRYTLNDLLACDTEEIDRFQSSIYCTTYLAPSDYHRVHMPLAGHLRKVCYQPGHLFSVNDDAVGSIPGIFARNERLLCYFDGEQGPFLLILVGAMFVGSMQLAWETEPYAYAKQPWSQTWQGEARRLLDRGELFGWFNMGSTVITLFAGSSYALNKNLSPGMTLRMGQDLGTT